jgi:hypothetical protein
MSEYSSQSTRNLLKYISVNNLLFVCYIIDNVIIFTSVITVILKVVAATTTTTSYSLDLLEKPPVVQLLENMWAFYGTWRGALPCSQRALYWSLSWATLVQSVRLQPAFLRTILIFSTHLHLGLPGGLFHSDSISILCTVPFSCL